MKKKASLSLILHGKAGAEKKAAVAAVKQAQKLAAGYPSVSDSEQNLERRSSLGSFGKIAETTLYGKKATRSRSGISLSPVILSPLTTSGSIFPDSSLVVANQTPTTSAVPSPASPTPELAAVPKPILGSTPLVELQRSLSTLAGLLTTGPLALSSAPPTFSTDPSLLTTPGPPIWRS